MLEHSQNKRRQDIRFESATVKDSRNDPGTIQATIPFTSALDVERLLSLAIPRTA